VRPRHTPGGTTYAAVYPGLAAGEYAVLRAEVPVLSVRVTGGAVTSARLPSADAWPVADGESERERDATHQHDRDRDDQEPLRLSDAG
jgi:hypothetical protein